MSSPIQMPFQLLRFGSTHVSSLLTYVMHAAIKLTQSQLLNPYKLHNTQHNRSTRTLRAIHHIENTQYTNKPKTARDRQLHPGGDEETQGVRTQRHTEHNGGDFEQHLSYLRTKVPVSVPPTQTFLIYTSFFIIIW